jgi:hypothetical protein
MFEDETIVVACPKCAFKNEVLVRELEKTDLLHAVCGGCKVGLKIEAKEFQHKLDAMREELEEIESEVKRERKPRPRKGDFQI